MKKDLRIRRLRSLLALLLALSLLAAACGSDDADAGAEADAPSSADGETDESTGDHSGDEDHSDDEDHDDHSDEDHADDAMADDAMQDDAMQDDGVANDAMADGSYPLDVATAGGTVTIEARPERIVSLSPTATEMLFAIGAGDQVAAVDLFSNYPAEAPAPTLDGYTPDLEAILGSDPDLVVATGLPEDITTALTENGVPVIFNPAAVSFDDIYEQVAILGEATGHIDGAATVNADIRGGIDAVLESLPEQEGPIRVFHELDDSFYSVTSNTFIGQVYKTMGFENIADPHDADGGGYPLIDGETIISGMPDVIVFTDQMSYTADDIAARPGWDTTPAVANGNIVEVNADIASRWGPRIVEFMETVASALLVGA
ncbi:MAG: ABC transporter substrate-binding protein [Actinomycetota bacterium]